MKTVFLIIILLGGVCMAPADDPSVDEVLVRWMRLIRAGEREKLFREVDALSPLTDYRPPTPPLVEAARVGNIEIVKGMLERSASIDFRNSEGTSALHVAMREDHPEVVALLLARGADPFVLTHYFYTSLTLTLKKEQSAARDRFLEILRATKRLEGFLDWEAATMKVRIRPQDVEDERTKYRRIIPEWGQR